MIHKLMLPAAFVCATERAMCARQQATGNRQQAACDRQSHIVVPIVPSRLISVLALYSFFIIVSLSWQMDESESNPL